MLRRIKEKADEPDLHFWEKLRFDDILTVLKIHKFWETEPIMFYHKKVSEGLIKHFKPAEVPQEPLPLPPGFEWCNFDVDNLEEVQEICKFLEDYYVEDDLGNFKVMYTPEKFVWAVKTPKSRPELHFLVRNS